jgi:hypothetical protein
VVLWAIQDSNTPADPSEKQHNAPTGAATSAAFTADSRAADGIAAALAMIATLPLTDAEKAEAVRRLLAEGAGR